MTAEHASWGGASRQRERKTSSRRADRREDVAELVADAATGDQRAWRLMVARFDGVTRSIARRHRLSETDQDEVSQRTWLRLVECIGSIREPAALAGWLATTAHHECLRLRRDSGRELTLDEATTEHPVQTGSVEEHAVENERRAALHAAVDRLAPHQRSLMRVLLLGPALTYDDVSASLGIPRGCLGPTRQRSIARLRRDPHLARVVSAATTSEARQT